MNAKFTFMLRLFLFSFLLVCTQNSFAQDITNSLGSNGNFIVKFAGPAGETIIDASEYGVSNSIINALGKFSVWGAYGTEMMKITSTDIINTVPTSFKVFKPGFTTPLMELTSSTLKFSNGTNVLFDITSSKFSIGLSNTVTGLNAFGIGRSLTSSGTYAIAMGDGSTASALNSIVIGKGSTASSEKSFAIGNLVEASGIQSFALGNNVSTDSYSGAF
ncbi:MAG: hypothetical protein PVF17_12215, partial [Ignavibacteria bacterium]